MSRSQLTSTVEQNTGGAVSPYVAGKNKIINGDFGIWQRGTSFTPTSAASIFTTDRFQIYQNGSGSFTCSQQTFTPGTAPVAGYESSFFHRIALTTLGTTNAWVFNTNLEDVRVFAGQTVTLSFWAKGTAATIGCYLQQNFGSGGSSVVQTAAQSNTLTTSWQRFTYTIAVPSISGKTIGTSSSLSVYFGSGTVLANTSWDIWGIQLEAGSVATPFTTATGTLSGELAACQRYFISYGGSDSNEIICGGSSFPTTGGLFIQSLPVEMRTTPTLGYSAIGDWSVWMWGTGGQALTALSISGGTGKKGMGLAYTSAALTNSGSNKAVYLGASTTLNARLTFSAEL